MDNLDAVWSKFFQQRTAPLQNRFPGIYRSIVVETNDPLNIGRIRFKCPDLHDWNIATGDCPWAVPALDHGGKRCGTWISPCIGDWVWIGFERGHPYGPIWLGFATPTRRKYYALPSIHQPSPLAVNDSGEPDSAPIDYNSTFLPTDGRPMSFGRQDRYGNLDISSSIGFYPHEHDQPPPPADFDPLQNTAFKQSQSIPKVNEPDAKFMARVTKYGNMMILGDQGYIWKKNGDFGEFSGNVNADDDFEIKRWGYIQRLINEDKASGNDQRQILSITRYGSKLELRDTGWAQPGPIASKSRSGEYGSSQYLSTEATNDFRWAKLRTKGGWLLQAYDKGFHPNDDEFIKRNLIDEVGPLADKEDVYWANKDARWFRIIGRYGIKFVIDERGTDPRRADSLESPRANGILLKGRRTGGCKVDGAITGDPRGFYFEFNENDDANHTTWGTPLGQAIEMNDATEYMALSTCVGRDYTRPFRGLAENEFLLEPTRARNPEANSHHFILDHQNEYLRLKTRGGNGPAARNPVNISGLSGGLHQGLEARDGSKGDGPWVEVVDSEHRGLWLSRDRSLCILRSKQGKHLYVWFDDNKNETVIYNGEAGGRIQLRSMGSVEVVSAGDIILHGKNVSIKADEKIKLEANSNVLTLESDRLSTTGDLYGNDGNFRVKDVPSLSDVTAIAQREAATRSNNVAANIVSAVKSTLDGISVNNNALTNTAINFTPSPVPSAVNKASGSGVPRPGGDRADDPTSVSVPARVEPSDRGAVYNSPSSVGVSEVEHPV